MNKRWLPEITENHLKKSNFIGTRSRDTLASVPSGNWSWNWFYEISYIINCESHKCVFSKYLHTFWRIHAGTMNGQGKFEMKSNSTGTSGLLKNLSDEVTFMLLAHRPPGKSQTILYIKYIYRQE